MKKIFITLSLLLSISMIGFAQAEKIVGKWKTIDDKEDGKVKAIVNIFKAPNGTYCGKIEKLFNNPDALCTECEGANKNKPILGLVIINNLVEKGIMLTGGTILDPKNGKVYKCNLSIERESDKLIVRGSLDKSGWIGRSQTWIKVK